MKLKNLIENAGVVSVTGDVEKEIKEVVCDSNSVTKGSLFICLKGRDYDGCGFIRQVENYGAAAIVTEKPTETSLTQVLVKAALSAKIEEYNAVVKEIDAASSVDYIIDVAEKEFGMIK